MKFLTNLTLAQKIILLPTIGLLVGVAVFSSLGMKAVNQATDTMLQERLTTAHLVADYLDETMGRALAELVNTAQGIDIEAVSENPIPRLETLKDIYSRLSIYTYGIFLVNESGKVIWSRSDAGVGSDYYMSSYPVISQSLQKGEASISGLVSAPASNTPVVLLVSPTKEAQGSRGALVIAIDLAQSSIGGFIQPITLGKTGYVEIIDQTGIVLARTEPGPKLSPFERSDHSGRFASLIAAGEPTRGLCHTCHEQVERVQTNDVLAFVPLSKVHWGVVIRQSEAEALAPIWELRKNLIFFGAGLVLIVFLFVALTTHDVTSRIKVLISASKRISNGDLISPVSISRKDELGILADTFEDMRNKLQKSYGELEQRTKELSSLLSVSEILSQLRVLSSLDTALGTALDKILEIIKESTGSILLLCEDKQSLYSAVNRGLYREDKTIYRLGEGIAGKVAQTGKAIIEDMSAQPLEPQLVIDNIRTVASIPLRSKEEVLGVLNIASRNSRKFSAEDLRLLKGIAREIAVAVESATLHQEVQRKEEVRGELLRDLFLIQEEEQKRIARELHDETSQVVSSLTANLGAAIGMLPPEADGINAILKKAQTLSINILDEIHKLIYELRPSLLDDLGLVAATRWMVDKNLKEKGINADVQISGRKRRLPARLEATVFRVIQEAVNNIARHAQAMNASVNLHFKKSSMKINIKDDGMGFDVNEAVSSKERPKGLGLLGMKERIELVSGKIEIRSHPGGGGTEIEIEIPLS